MIDMDAKRFLEDPDVQGESGLNTYYSRDLVLEMLDAAIDAALAAAPAQPDNNLQMASPIFALAVQALNGVKAWRDCEGNDGFPDEVREQIDAVLSAFELRYTAQPATHPTTGEPMGTAEQEATAWKLTVENLERENAALREALLRGVREVEALKRECGTDPESWQAIRNGVYMDISYRMRAALAGTAPAPSKEYAELPKQPLLHAYEIQENGSLKAAFGYSAGQTLAFADATHALRTGGKK